MNRLGEFWRERGTLGKALIVVVAAVVAFTIIGAVTSSSDDDTTGTPATTSTENEAKPSPSESCADRGRLPRLRET
jgi:hypothetical protein